MTSNGLAARASAVLPGGVNSPVRAFRAVGGDPVFAREAHGAYLTTVSGEKLLDYVMSWGAVILGHDHPAVRSRLTTAVTRGVSFGVTCPAEVELAELICDMVPSIEMVRFVNSGTEATMSAARLARAATGRDVIVKVDGGYHGHGDSFLVSAGSGVATLGLPNSPGVPAELAKLTLTVPFNDAGEMESVLTEFGDRVAAVILEPFLGNAGFIPPAPGYLEAVRSLTRASGTLLIFDEVMTGFRVGTAGAQGTCGVTPDITTLGKVIGGGLPIGAYGGRKELMELVAPAGPVYQAGTLSGNPLAMAAGLAVLSEIRREDPYDALSASSGLIAERLASVAASRGVPMSVAHAGGMWGFFFHPGPVVDYAAAKAADTDLFARFHREALRLGVLLAPSPFEAGFVSLAHTNDIITETTDRLTDALDRSIAE